jgi:hypothetical protein
MFTSFQNDYLDHHVEQPKSKKLGKWSLFVLAITLSTTVGLFAISNSSEPLSDQIQNAVSFGVVFCVVIHMIAIPFILLGMTILGGVNVALSGLGEVAKSIANKDEELDAEDAKCFLEAQKMMLMRHQLSVLRPTILNTFKKTISKLLVASLIVGLVLNGYNFGGMVVLLSLVLSLMMAAQSYNRAKQR